MQAQCVFCKFGATTFDAIKEHLVDCHPSKLPLFCERSQESNVSPSSIDSVPIRYIGVRKYNILKIKKFNLYSFLQNPRNDKIIGLKMA